MEDDRKSPHNAGRFLPRGKRHPGHSGRWLMVSTLLIWDGILLYMIVECLIAPVYGAAFVAAISIYLGYQL